VDTYSIDAPTAQARASSVSMIAMALAFTQDIASADGPAVAEAPLVGLLAATMLGRIAGNPMPRSEIRKGGGNLDRISVSLDGFEMPGGRERLGSGLDRSGEARW
jgi:hypothetical protein